MKRQVKVTFLLPQNSTQAAMDRAKTMARGEIANTIMGEMMSSNALVIEYLHTIDIGKSDGDMHWREIGCQCGIHVVDETEEVCIVSRRDGVEDQWLTLH